jgi:hypothetical protein
MRNNKIWLQDARTGDSRSATVACRFKVGLDKNLNGLFAGMNFGGYLYGLAATCVPKTTLREPNI